MKLRRDVAVVGALLIATACGDEPPPSWCDDRLWEVGWDIEGLPPPGTAPEWVVTRSITFEPVPGEWRTQFWLPWDLNRRQAYYVRDEDPVFVRVRLMNGISPTGTATLRAFVDTENVTLIHEGVEMQEVTVELVDGLADAIVEIPTEWFPDGLSLVSLHVHYDYGEPRPYFVPYGDVSTWSFSVVKNTPDGVGVFPDTPGYELGEVRPGYPYQASFLDTEFGVERNFESVWFLPNAGRPTRVTLRLQSDSWAGKCDLDTTPKDTFAIVALLDGERVPLGEHDAIVGTVGPHEQRVFEFDVEFPDDGDPHRYELLRLGGLGWPARLRGMDAVSPWGPAPWPVATVMYGDERFCADDGSGDPTWCFGM